MRFRSSLLSMALLLLLLPEVKAVDLYNNLGANVGQSASINNSYLVGLSFQTTAMETVVTDLKASLNTSATAGSTIFSIYDASGTSGRPGSKITDAGTILNSSITSSSSTLTVSGLNISLSPSTNYWLVLSGLTTDFVNWSVTTSTSGATGSVGIGTKTGPGSWNLITSYRAIGAVTAVASVPEPSTYALAAITTGVMAAVARRRRARLG